MEINSRKHNFNDEHKEMGKDLLSVIISYTPISGIADTAKFIYKWIYRKRAVHRIAHSVEKYRRKLRLKNRGYGQ